MSDPATSRESDPAPSREATIEPTESRRIVLLRHAKADWPEVSDHERPLAERGRKDAPVAGRWLAGTGISPNLTLCSTATRSRETWKLVVHELPQRPRTVYEERLYEASLGELIALLNETSDEVRDLLVVGHNPGMHALADALAGEAEGDALARMSRGGFPTAAIAVVGFNGSWKSVEHGVGTLLEYWAPHE
ncbi:SixA phosphatase family protein [Streptomyces sp. KR80]|uniref:SixA phosphatase family protein n=1 Tax=Streptomyces sp. KR80 TaxID=3457426 RepID=UPI003FD4CC89